MATGMTEQRQEQSLSIRQQLNDPAMIKALQRSMPKHCDPDRFARIVTTQITKSPNLAKCDPASFFGALLSLSQWGLEPDGRRAHLIPFKNGKKSEAAGREVYDCQLIIDYKGIVELVKRSGEVKGLHADVVRQGDLFEYSRGRVIKHVPWFLRTDRDKPAAAGEVYAIYCCADLGDGSTQDEVMSVEEVNKSRDASSGYQQVASGATSKEAWKRAKYEAHPWVKHWEEMAKKTVFRRLSKWLTWSADIRDAIEHDDDTPVMAIAGEIVSSESEPESLAGLLRDEMEDGDSAETETPPKPTKPSRAKDDAEMKPLAQLQADLNACKTIQDYERIERKWRDATFPGDEGLQADIAMREAKERLG